MESIIAKLASGEIIIFVDTVSLKSRGDWIESHFVGNPVDRFCRVKAQMNTECQQRHPQVMD